MAPILVGFTATCVVALLAYWQGPKAGLAAFAVLVIVGVALAATVLDVETRSSGVLGSLAGLPVLIGSLLARSRRTREPR